MAVFIASCIFILHPNQKSLTVKNHQATSVGARVEVQSPDFPWTLFASSTLKPACVLRDSSTMVSEFINNFFSGTLIYSSYFDGFSLKE